MRMYIAEHQKYFINIGFTAGMQKGALAEGRKTK
jgi:hypothetical protein